MRKVEYTGQFKKDLKLAKRRNQPLAKLRDVMKKIECGKPLAVNFKDHLLSGNWHGHRELHIKPDWLLIYKLVDHDETVIFVRTGTHSDLFR